MASRAGLVGISACSRGLVGQGVADELFLVVTVAPVLLRHGTLPLAFVEDEVTQPAEVADVSDVVG